MFLTAVVIKMCLTNAHGLRVTWRVSHLGAQGVRALLNLGGDCKAWEMQVRKNAPWRWHRGWCSGESCPAPHHLVSPLSFFVLIFIYF